jgi:hypothetical protein
MAGVGTPRRLSYGAVAAGIGGAVLIISLFLSWFSEAGFSQTGWETFKFTDIVLFLLGLLAIGYALIELTSAPVTLPVDRGRALTVIGIIATTLTLEFLIEGSHQAIGLILAVLASLAILAGGVLAERRPELAVVLGGAAGPAGPAAGPGPAATPTVPPGSWGQPAARPGPVYGQQPQEPAAGAYGQPGAAEPAAERPPATQQPFEPAPPPFEPAAPAEPASPPPPPGGVADWYPDPTGQKRLRYWDGNQWTEHVAD